ncbi:MAG TPA: hypothetical protein VIG99_03220 [Myxococcaceae bacterium]
MLGTVLAFGCGWLPFLRYAQPIERKVTVPFGEPGRVSLVTLRGDWLRAAQIASDDFFRDWEIPPNATPLEVCVSRRESYDVEVWAQTDPADGGEPDEDAGTPDSGNPFGTTVPRILFVSIALNDTCDLGESPPTDMSGQYAIDTTTWQIVGWRL